MGNIDKLRQQLAEGKARITRCEPGPEHKQVSRTRRERHTPVPKHKGQGQWTALPISQMGQEDIGTIDAPSADQILAVDKKRTKRQRARLHRAFKAPDK